MASFNRVILMGNLTRDPEMRYLANGTAVAQVGLAVNDRRKGKDGDWVEEAVFVDVTLWARTAEIAVEYLTRGSAVLIEGRLKLETWEAKDGGGKRSKMVVVCDHMTLMGSKQGGGGRSDGDSQRDEPPPEQQSAPPAAAIAENDIPF